MSSIGADGHRQTGKDLAKLSKQKFEVNHRGLQVSTSL